MRVYSAPPPEQVATNDINGSSDKMADILPVDRDATSLRQQVTHRLRDSIVDGTLEPGAKLIERELCEMLGISRALLREALQQLQAEGLVTAIPHKGQFVAVIGVDEMAELYNVVGSLESLAVSEFTKKASEEQVRALRGELEAIKTNLKQGEPRTLLGLKDKYYPVLLDGCANRVIVQFLTQLTNRMMPLRRLSMTYPGRIELIPGELEAVVAAIEARNPEEAATCCMRHINNARNAAMAMVASQTAEKPAPVKTRSRQKTVNGPLKNPL